VVNGHPTERLVGTLNLSFIGVEGESLILSLDLEGVAVSSGSACTAGLSEPSHVLLAMGVAPRTAQSSLRFSVGWENTTEDIDATVDILVPIVEWLRRISTFG
jgi:cysteine desulfurase